jgi:AraC-like DNA-binding protein
MGVHLGADVIAKSVPLKVAQIIIPVNGNLIDHTQGKSTIAMPEKSAIVHTPNYPVNVRWQSKTSALVIRIPEDYFHNIYETITNEEMPRNFQLYPQLDLTNGPGYSLLNITRNVLMELNSGNKFSHDSRLMDMWEELLVTTLLSSQIPFSQRILQSRNNVPVYRYVKKTTEYIMTNINEPIALQELVNTSGVSLRTLQIGFKKIYGVGLMTYIRQQKLKRIYQELLESSPQNNKVGDIAANWGFFHASNFTKIYKKQFSELPSETLGTS